MVSNIYALILLCDQLVDMIIQASTPDTVAAQTPAAATS
jgi:hypothetical protein